MAEVARNKKYVTLDNVRVSHRSKDDSIHLSSSDDELPTGFHLPLQKGTFVEEQMREILTTHGIIDPGAEPLDILPTSAPWEAHYVTDPTIPWSFFPLGLSNQGGVLVKHPLTGKVEHVVGVDFQGNQKSLGDKGKIEPSNEVTYSPNLLMGGSTGVGKSSMFHNILRGCVMRPEHWRAMVIDGGGDLIRWRRYSNVVLEVGTTLDEALILLRFAQATLLERYASMEAENVAHFKDLSTNHKALMVVVDDLESLITPQGSLQIKDAEGISPKEEISGIISTIARLGRAGGVHLAMAVQASIRSDLEGSTRANFGARLAMGRMSGDESIALLGNREASRVRSKVRGRFHLRIDSEGVHAQALVGPPEWLDGWLLGHGLQPDGSPVPAGFFAAPPKSFGRFENGGLSG